jgi:uncharacterized membrane protein
MPTGDSPLDPRNYGSEVFVKRWFLVGALGLPLTSACTAGAPERSVQLVTELAAGQVILRGHATFGHEVRTLQPCGEQEPLWAVDSTGTLWELHHDVAQSMGREQRLFAIVVGRRGARPADGFGAGYDGSVVVDKVVYLAGEGFDCALDLRDVYYRAAGNEPFWFAEITVDGVTLRQLGEDDLTGTVVRSEPAPDGMTYRTADRAGAVVTISNTPCRDSMSGAFYGYSARVSVAGRTLTGCAMQGLAEAGS